jgi:large subunit ribosomal protein L9
MQGSSRCEEVGQQMAQEVILLEDVEGLGTRGATVRVAPGYARNYLIPYRKAMAASVVGERMLQQMERGRLHREAKERKNAEALAAVLNGTSLSFERQVGEEDKLYGSVSVQDIVEALDARGLSVDRRKVLLAEPLKSLGEFDVQIRCYADITATVTINVVRAE